MTRASTESAPRRVGALTLAFLLVLGLAHVAWLSFCYDDAFVSFRYADHLVQGQGLVYNPGERVEGYSNFLWTLLMSLVIAAGGRPESWSLILGGAFALGSLALVTVAARRFGASAVWTGVLVAANASWAAWGTGGLETALFGFCLTAGALAMALAEEQHDPARWFAGSGLAFGLACLTRPDGMLVAGAAGAFLAGRAICRRVPADTLAWWLAPLALCVAPHVAWRLAYYGEWLPHTFGVKQPGLGHFAHGIAYLAGAVRDLHLYLLAIPLAASPFVRNRATSPVGTKRVPADQAAGTSRAHARGAALGIALLVPFASYLASTGGDFMPLYRFVAPVVPLLGLAAATAWGRIERAAGSARAGVTVALWAAGVTYVGLHAYGSWRQQSVWSSGDLVSVGWSRQEMDEWLRIGDLLRRAAQPTDTLATTAAGAIPYRSHLYTIDLHGLNAPDLARYRRRDSERPGHQLMLEGRWLDAQPPQILLGHPLVHPTPASLTVGIDLEPEWRERVLSHYELVGMRLPGEPTRFVGCAIRRDAVDRIIEAARVPTNAAP